MPEETLRENKMGTMPENKLLLSMAVPMMISMLVQALYNIVDSIFVSRICEDALTAVSMAFPWQNIVIAIAVGFGVGINALLSRALGQKNAERVNQVAVNGLLLAGLSYLLVLVAGLIGIRAYMRTQTDIETIVNYGITYLNICILCSFGVFVEITFERFLQATGRTVYSMITQLTGAITNIILDPILIFGLLGFPALGVAGGGIATVIGQISALLLYIIVYRRNSYAVHISFKHLVFDKAIIRQIYSVGIPSTVMMLLPSILISVLNSILTAFSDVYVAVLGVYFKLQTFIYMPANGIVQGMRPIIGYNYGAGESSRVKSTIRYSLLTAAGLMLTGTILALALPKQILALFDADAALMSAGVTALRIISLGFLVSSVGLIYSGVFEAIGNGRNSLIISLLRQFVITIPLSFILTRFFGPTDVPHLFPVGELCASAAAFCLLKKYQNGAFSPL